MNGKHALTKNENSKHDVNLRVFANNNCVVTKKTIKKPT